MKKYLYILLCLAQYPCFAQLRTLSSGLNITGGTTFSIDSLVLIPSSNLSITNNTISKRDTPVTGTGGASIRQAYRFASPLSFTGTIGVRYSSARLNGNTEANQQIVYNSSSTGGSYITTTGSTRGAAGTYYVSNTLTAITIGQITSTNSGVALPLVLLDFSARAAGNCTAIISWTTTNTSAGTFVAEASANGRNWQEMAGQLKVSGYSYELSTSSGPELTYYRLRMTELSGAVSYSSTQVVTNSCETPISISLSPNPVHDQCRILSTGGPATLIHIYDATGRLITTAKSDEKGATVLDMSSCSPGTYLAECLFESRVITTRFTKE